MLLEKATEKVMTFENTHGGEALRGALEAQRKAEVDSATAKV